MAAVAGLKNVLQLYRGILRETKKQQQNPAMWISEIRAAFRKPTTDKEKGIQQASDYLRLLENLQKHRAVLEVNNVGIFRETRDTLNRISHRVGLQLPEFPDGKSFTG